MRRSLSCVVVPRTLMHTLIATARTQGHEQVACEFEALLALVAQDSQNVPPELVCISQDYVLATLAVFCVQDNAVGQQMLIAFVRQIALPLNEDDIALVRDATRRTVIAQRCSLTELSPQASEAVVDAYYYVLTQGLAIAEGDLDYFCANATPRVALKHYCARYFRLQQAAAYGLVSLESMYSPLRVKAFLDRALTDSTVPAVFDEIDIS